MCCEKKPASSELILYDIVFLTGSSSNRNCLYASDGASSVEAALKLALQYWANIGRPKKQKLIGVQLPLALPNIMQGINQCTMMALAMVVIASMIGTRGLGDEVLLGLQQLNVGRAAEAGIAIVLLAIVLDRITQSYGETLQERTTPAKKEKK